MTEKSTKKTKKSPKTSSTFVENPFQMPHVDVEAAQNSNEELILDEPTEETMDETTGDLATDSGPASEEFSPIFSADEEAQLNKLTDAMVEQQAKDLADAEAAATSLEEESKLELARQIAEDEALERQLAEEQKQLDEEGDAELRAALPQANASGELDLIEIQSCIETLLFMTDKPMPIKKIKAYLTGDAGEAADVTEAPATEMAESAEAAASEDAPAKSKSKKSDTNKINAKLFKEAVAAMKERYAHPAHGMELVEVAGGLQFRTKPGRAALARLLSKVTTQRLSRGAMETLAIIAYKQPMMKEEIDAIRGVDSSHFIRGLLEKKLVEIMGRSDLPGRPMLYKTSEHFLEVFGLNELTDMPPLRELEKMIPSSETEGGEEKESDDPKTRMLRKLVGEMRLNSDQLGYNPQEDEVILREIKERVKGISTTTPYLAQQAEQEKLAREGGPAGATATDPEANAHIGEGAQPELLASEVAPDAQAEAPSESLDSDAAADPELSN
ncbi:MAG: SMC-Scp complex subunit ScpB [Bacteriovoracia bacterium]